MTIVAKNNDIVKKLKKKKIFVTFLFWVFWQHNGIIYLINISFYFFYSRTLNTNYKVQTFLIVAEILIDHAVSVRFFFFWR